MKENNQVFSVPNKKICVYESDLCSSENKACEKIQACSVFKPMTSAIPMRCGTCRYRCNAVSDAYLMSPRTHSRENGSCQITIGLNITSTELAYSSHH